MSSSSARGSSPQNPACTSSARARAAWASAPWSWFRARPSRSWRASSSPRSNRPARTASISASARASARPSAWATRRSRHWREALSSVAPCTEASMRSGSQRSSCTSRQCSSWRHASLRARAARGAFSASSCAPPTPSTRNCHSTREHGTSCGRRRSSTRARPSGKGSRSSAARRSCTSRSSGGCGVLASSRPMAWPVRASSASRSTGWCRAFNIAAPLHGGGVSRASFTRADCSASSTSTRRGVSWPRRRASDWACCSKTMRSAVETATCRWRRRDTIVVIARRDAAGRPCAQAHW